MTVVNQRGYHWVVIVFRQLMASVTTTLSELAESAEPPVEMNWRLAAATE